MDHDMLTDVTLDHLPDLSEESVSFQIPDDNNASADLLLDDFDLLRDDGVSFAPVTPRRPRGPPLTLEELTPSQPTPRPQSSTQQRPTSSAQSTHPLTLGHVSPGKRRKTPRTKSVRREWESPFLSEEGLRQLRVEIDMLGQVGEPPCHVLIDTLDAGDKSSTERRSPPRAHSRSRDAPDPDSPSASEDCLDPPQVEKSAETPSDENVAMNPGDEPTDTTDVAVPTRPKSKRNPRTSTKSTGGITKHPSFPATHVQKKTLRKPPRVREVHQIPPSAASQPTPPQSIAIDTEGELAPPACLSGNIDSKPRSTQITHPNTGGMAERLVSYSQRLISSIGLYKHIPENSSAESSKNAVRVGDVDIRSQPPAAAQLSSPTRERIDKIPGAQNGPLRLSEVSPQKSPPKVPLPSSPAHSGASQDGKERAMSPMRPPRKRVTLDADLPQEIHARKRGKTMTAESERGSSDEAVSQAHSRLVQTSHVDQPISHSETRRSTHHLDSSKPALPSARTKYRPKPSRTSERKGPTLDPFPYLTQSRQVRGVINGRKRKEQGGFKAANISSLPLQGEFSAGPRQGRGAKTRGARPIAPAQAREHDSGPGLIVDLPLIERKQSATVTVPLTKPVGFTFRVDARLEARKEQDRLAASAPERTGVIDEHVKPLRASHPAGCQSGHVVPVPFFFSTEQRAKEREKFDEMVRIKEEEMQKLKEEQRRLEAEEEERTIKEMRRRAIPKANEVPEWYADMPKKKTVART